MFNTKVSMLKVLKYISFGMSSQWIGVMCYKSKLIVLIVCGETSSNSGGWSEVWWSFPDEFVPPVLVLVGYLD